IFYKAILNASDWTGSAHLLLETGENYTSSDIADKIIEKFKAGEEQKEADDFSFKEFQKQSKYEGNDVIAIAPTGSGKTEAALLWASNKKDWERIIYLLPTRVTSNAIFKRLQYYFNRENVALIHSSAR